MPREAGLSELRSDSGRKLFKKNKKSSLPANVQLVAEEQNEELVVPINVNPTALGKNLKKINKGAGQFVGRGVGVAGKGTVRATQFVGKGVGAAKKETVKLGARTGKGAVTATKFVGKNAVKVGKNTVGVVGNLPGNAIDVAGLTVKGVTNLPGNAIHLATLAARRLQRSDAAATAAWKTRATSRDTKVELQISCRNLPRKDTFAESDAFAVIWQVPNGYGSEIVIGKPGDESVVGAPSVNGSWNTVSKRPRINRLPGKVEKEIGRTEIIKGSQNPEFVNTFVLDFKFQEEQTYVVRVYDRDLEFSPDLKEHDYLGGAVFTLGELMGNCRRTIRRPLRAKGSNGSKSILFIQGNEVKSTRSVMEFRFSAEDLKDKDKVIDSDPDLYFRLSKLNLEDQTWQPVYKSEVVMHNENPTWARARIPLPEICNDNTYNPIKLEFFDWVRGGHDEPVGYVETTCQNLVSEAERGIPVYDVWRDLERTFRRTKTIKKGKIKVLRSTIKPVPTILEFVAGGLKLDVTVAIDLSVHNGPLEKSLHGRASLAFLNDYESTICRLGDVLGPYVNNEEFNVWGFGANLQGEPTAHFPLGEDGPVKGANGMLDIYDKTFSENPHFMEPTEDCSIAPLIQTAMYEAIQKLETQQSYSVLCILTAGKIIDDLAATIDMVCTAAEDAPLSVVIIGLGSNVADFEDIKVLLANGGKLRHSNDVPIARDMVSFASFDECGNAEEVVAEALKELPEQLVEHFAGNGIEPQPRVDMSSASSYDKSSRRRRHRQSRTKGSSASPRSGSSRRRVSDR